MRISPVNSYFTTKYNTPANKKEEVKNRTNNMSLPTAYYPVSFSGGISMNLKATKELLDAKITEEYNPYPQSKGLIEHINEVIAGGNPEEKTLIDVHKEYFGRLEQCETLEDAKKEYPEEFGEVLSDEEASKTSIKTFIDAVKSGKVEGFIPDVDVSLQLLQLYWGKGVSQSYIQDHCFNTNFSHILRKFQIPSVSQRYGEYLKFSDKNYNEYYTGILSERMQEINRIRQEKNSGIDIPKGHLSPEQRANISKGLKKYYSEHPERLQEMSQRIIKFYRENPEERDILSLVMLRAWSYPEASKLRTLLSQLLKKELSRQDIDKSINPKSRESEAFRKFWNENDWAKPIFSKCLTKSWKEQAAYKTEPIPQYAPSQANEEVNSYVKENYPDSTDLEKDIIDIFEGKTPQKPQAAVAAERFFIDNPKIIQNIAYSRLYGTINAFKEFAVLNHLTRGEQYSDLSYMLEIYEKNISKKDGSSLEISDINSMYNELISYCGKNNPEAENIIKKRINSNYDSLSNMLTKDIVAYGENTTKELLEILAKGLYKTNK